jgi:hypothetical protein
MKPRSPGSSPYAGLAGYVHEEKYHVHTYMLHMLRSVVC